MAASPSTAETVAELTQGEYKYGFVTDIESVTAPKGLNEDTVRFISAKKGEPMLPHGGPGGHQQEDPEDGVGIERNRLPDPTLHGVFTVHP